MAALDDRETGKKRMATSGEMRATIPATLGDLNDLENKITKRQDKYEEDCASDRKLIRGNVDSLAKSLTEIKEETVKGNDLIRPIAEMFKGVWANPKVQNAMILVVLAGLGYLALKLNDMANKVQQQPQQSQQNAPQTIVVYPQAQGLTDGGIIQR